MNSMLQRLLSPFVSPPTRSDATEQVSSPEDSQDEEELSHDDDESSSHGVYAGSASKIREEPSSTTTQGPNKISQSPSRRALNEALPVKPEESNMAYDTEEDEDEYNKSSHNETGGKLLSGVDSMRTQQQTTKVDAKVNATATRQQRSKDSQAASVIDESRREGKYDTPSTSSRTRLDFSDGLLEMLKEQQQKNDAQSQQMQAQSQAQSQQMQAQSQQMQALYERLLAMKPDMSTLKVEKATTQDEGKKRRKDLPRIEYSKLVTLSLSNFDEYKISIYNLGYSREWPNSWSKPSFTDLKEEWDGAPDADEEKGIIRREAYLVLYNTIPRDLKYLVRKVESGDVMGLWKALFNRFLHVTTSQVSAMLKE